MSLYSLRLTPTDIKAHNNQLTHPVLILIGGRHLEMGAQWIHGEEDNPAYELAAKNNLIAYPDSSDDEQSINSLDGYWQTQFFTQDGKYVNPVIVKEICELLDGIFGEADRFSRESIPLTHKDESIGTVVSETFYKYLRTTECDLETRRFKEAIFNWRLQWEKAENACKSIYEMSAYAWGEFLECKGDESVTLVNGFQPLLDILLKEIPIECIRLHTPVQSIYWDPDRSDSPPAIHMNTNSACVTAEKKFSGQYPLGVRTKSGEMIPADHVIVTASLGVLKKSAHTMFKPILPREKMAAIQRIGFGTVDKL